MQNVCATMIHAYIVHTAGKVVSIGTCVLSHVALLMFVAVAMLG